jgi:hypothetical protein
MQFMELTDRVSLDSLLGVVIGARRGPVPAGAFRRAALVRDEERCSIPI